MEKRRILISVTDKTGVEKFSLLVNLGWEIISTGGTADLLQQKGISCTPIERITGFPEMMNGRLKTIHPNIFGGILADRSNPEHMATIAKHGILPIDIVVVNLYSFTKKPGIENIDIGGPSLLRAAAKNVSSVTVIVDPSDYSDVINEISVGDNTTRQTRENLAVKVFHHTAVYDKCIFEWMRAKKFTGSIFDQPAEVH